MKRIGGTVLSFQTRRSLLRNGVLLGTAAIFRWISGSDAPAMAQTQAALEISGLQLAGLRHLRFIWVPNVESGGPSVDFEAPFGSPEAYDDLGKISKIKSAWDLKRLYAAIMMRLEAFTEKANLAPGTYMLPPDIVHRLNQFMNAGDSGIATDGSFRFTDEHSKLIAALRWVYPEETRLSFVFNLFLGHRAVSGAWRVPTVNFKRPFGDMSYFEIDMAEVFGIPFKPNAHDPQEERLFALYRQMHIALQVFVMNATL